MLPEKIELYAVPGLPLIKPGDHLGNIISQALCDARLRPESGDVLVIAQKIISKAQGQQVRLCDIKPSEQACLLARKTDKAPQLVELILRESTEVVKTAPGVIIVVHRLGHVTANAGIDQSNVEENEGTALLLPRDPDGTAAELRRQWETEFGVRLGVIICDSVGRPWRLGTTGLALGCAGVMALNDLRGELDLFGRELKVSETAVADMLASAAQLLMGEASQARPLVLIKGASAWMAEHRATDLLRPAEKDLFRDGN